MLSQLKYGIPPAGMSEPLFYDTFKLKLDSLGRVTDFSLFLNEKHYLTEQHQFEGNKKVKRLIQLLGDGSTYEVDYVNHQNSGLKENPGIQPRFK